MRRVLITVILFGLGVGLYADGSDAYSGIFSIFSFMEDDNTGLTVFPTLLIPMGGRMEGMGTAFTAVADDSGFLETNPAASAVLFEAELSFFHHSWIADANVEGVVYTFRRDNWGFGFGGKFLFVPFTAYNGWGERSASGIISETILIVNTAYNFFSSYDFYGLAAGINLKLAYRYIPASIYPGQSAFSIMADFGLLTRFNLFKFDTANEKNFSLGIALKNIGLPALGEPLPTLVSTGIAYAPISPLTIAIDFNLPLSFDPNYPAEHWYLTTGFDIIVTSFLSIQTGFQLKENPRFSVGGTFILDTIAFTANYNLDLSASLNPLDKFSVEAKFKLGDSGRGEAKRQVETLYAKGIEAYANGDYQEAITYWEQVLELDPGFTPAAEGLDVVKKHLELRKELEDKQRVGEEKDK